VSFKVAIFLLIFVSFLFSFFTPYLLFLGQKCIFFFWVKSGPYEILFCTPQSILSHIFQAITVWQGKGDLNAMVSGSLKMAPRRTAKTSARPGISAISFRLDVSFKYLPSRTSDALNDFCPTPVSTPSNPGFYLVFGECVDVRLSLDQILEASSGSARR
jgi:hypothetical protein